MRPKTLDQLIDEAEREGKWLYSAYQNLWFSPRELRQANADGRFRWGPENWELRDPKELVDAAMRDVNDAKKRLNEVVARVAVREVSR